jgi:hypothetical protein
VHPRRVNLPLAGQEHHQPIKTKNFELSPFLALFAKGTNTGMIRHKRMNQESSNRVYAPSLGVGLDCVEVGFPTGGQDVLQKPGAEASQSKNSSR